MTKQTGRTFVKRRGTTAVPNATVYDTRLSYAALGVLLVSLARPESAPHGYRAIQGRGLGQAATLSALRELSDAGYRHQVRRNVGGGRFVVDTVISDEPISPEVAADWLSTGLWKTGDTVRRNPTRGATSANAPSVQVAPRGASPQPGPPWHGQAPHVSNETQGTTGPTVPVVPDETNAPASRDIRCWCRHNRDSHPEGGHCVHRLCGCESYEAGY